MKTIKLTGEALELARQLAWMLEQGQKQLDKMKEDAMAVQATLQREYQAQMKKIISTAGLGDDVQGSVDTTYLADHGDVYIQVQPKQDLASLLEGVVAAAVGQTGGETKQ